MKIKKFYINNDLLLNLYKKNKNFSHNTEIVTKLRNTLIVSEFLGMRFRVYNGKSYLNVKITSFMIGHKLGEFAFTRKPFTYKKKKKKNFYGTKK